MEHSTKVSVQVKQLVDELLAAQRMIERLALALRPFAERSDPLIGEIPARYKVNVDGAWQGYIEYREVNENSIPAHLRSSIEE